MKATSMFKKYGMVIGFLFIVLLFSLFAYITYSIYYSNDSFSKAEELYAKKQYEEAEHFFVVFLQNGTGAGKRWSAWNHLQYITIQLKSDFNKGIANLEQMEKEFGKDTEKYIEILRERIELYYKKRDKKNTILAIEAILNNPNISISDKEKIALYKRYSTIISGNPLFLEQGAKQFTLCTTKEDKEVAVWCQYELGVIAMLSEQYTKARGIFNSILKTVSIEDELGYLSTYMLGNIAVSVGESAKARAYFTSIKNIYPNKEAILFRIQSLP